LFIISINYFSVSGNIGFLAIVILAEVASAAASFSLAKVNSTKVSVSAVIKVCFLLLSLAKVAPATALVSETVGGCFLLSPLAKVTSATSLVSVTVWGCFLLLSLTKGAAVVVAYFSHFFGCSSWILLLIFALAEAEAQAEAEAEAVVATTRATVLDGTALLIFLL
jgi:hypothetical protein